MTAVSISKNSVGEGVEDEDPPLLHHHYAPIQAKASSSVSLFCYIGGKSRVFVMDDTLPYARPMTTPNQNNGLIS